jgi:hypothetical protein
MGQAIRCTCSRCQREIYFDPTAGISLDELSTLACSACGHVGAVLTLSIEAPTDAHILDRVPRTKNSSTMS